MRRYRIVPPLVVHDAGSDPGAVSPLARHAAWPHCLRQHCDAPTTAGDKKAGGVSLRPMCTELHLSQMPAELADGFGLKERTLSR